MRCVTCHCENRADAAFCSGCGQRLVLLCPTCGRENSPKSRFCDGCGLRLQAPSDREEAPAGQTAEESPARSRFEPFASNAERRQLTVMFCDVVGSTPLSQHLDPEDLREVMRTYQEVCARAIERFGGHIAQYLGDGLLVYFGYPQAHEDDAARGVWTALEILKEIPSVSARLQERIPAMRERPLQVRIGIHTGLVVAGEVGAGATRDRQGIVGETPNLAARLQTVAAPNSAVISEATRRLVSDMFDLKALGPKTLRGIAEPVPVHSVLQPREVPTPREVEARARLTPLVGREEEVRLLWEHWEQVRDRTGQVVLLEGEAGIGKSRMVQVLHERLAAERHTWLECRCSPHTENTAFYPVIEMLSQRLQFTTEDTAEEQLDKLEEALKTTGLSLPDTAPLFATLLSVPLGERYAAPRLAPEGQRRNTLEALVQWLVQLAAEHPVIMVVDDLHWVDPSTLELLSLLIDREPTTHLLLLLTFRSDFHPPWPMHGHLTRLTLSRLGRSQVPEMAQGVAEGMALPPEVVEQIVARTDGVPLYVEELTKGVLESGLLVEHGEHYEFKGDVTELAIPSTLQDSLTARLDALSEAKPIAQVASALGREFSYRLLAAVADVDEPTLREGLARVVESELVFQRGEVPEATYTFKHALIQEAAYESMLRRTRKKLHARIARVLEERWPQRVEAEPQLMAYHLDQAGEAARAAAWYQRAGEQARARPAFAEGERYLERGIELLATLPASEARLRQDLSLHVALWNVVSPQHSMASSKLGRLSEQVVALATEVGDVEARIVGLADLANYRLALDDPSSALEIAREMLGVAGRSGDPRHLTMSHNYYAWSLLCLGELSSALEHGRRGVSVASGFGPSRHPGHPWGGDARVEIRCWTGLIAWFAGYADEALRLVIEAAKLFRENDLPWDTNDPAVFHSVVLGLRGEVAAAAKLAEQTIDRCEKIGALRMAAIARALGAWIAALSTREPSTATELPEASAAARGSGVPGPWVLWLLADANHAAGNYTDALRTAESGLEIAAQTGQHMWDAELLRLQGECVLAQEVESSRSKVERPRSAPGHDSRARFTAKAEAERLFRRALDLARGQEARSFELRAATSLARLLRHQDRSVEAQAVLVPVYEWFTEGFDTQDLKDAKALLEELL